MTATATTSDPATPLAAELADVRAELTRVDGKAGMLLGVAGVMTALVGSLLVGQLDRDAALLGWTATAGLALSTATLLAVVWPRTHRLSTSTTFAAHVDRTPEQVLDRLADTASLSSDRAALLIGLSRLVALKYQLCRWAVIHLVAGIVLMLGALASAHITRFTGS